MSARGVRTPHEAVQVQPSDALSTHAVGEAHAHVQGESLKACAVFFVRLLNSPITRTGSAGMKFRVLIGLSALLLFGCQKGQNGQPNTSTSIAAAKPNPRVSDVSPSNGADLMSAFKVAFGGPAPFTKETESGDQVVYSPQAFINIEPGVVALISKGEIPQGCHACYGATSIHYLKKEADGYSLLGAWQDISGKAPWGKAAPWSVRTDIDDSPMLVFETDDGGQGASIGTYDLVALTPVGPVVRAEDITVSSGNSESTPPCMESGILLPIERGHRFAIQFSGTKSYRATYTRYGDQYLPDDGPVPGCS